METHHQAKTDPPPCVGCMSMAHTAPVFQNPTNAQQKKRAEVVTSADGCNPVIDTSARSCVPVQSRDGNGPSSPTGESERADTPKSFGAFHPCRYDWTIGGGAEDGVWAMTTYVDTKDQRRPFRPSQIYQEEC